MQNWPPALERLAERLAEDAGRLLATIATHDDGRRPLGWVVDAVFIGVVDELEQRQIPRRVVADMMGVSHRTLQRRINETRAGAELRRRSIWVQIVDVLAGTSLSREQVAERFHRADPLVVASLLRDMVGAGVLVEEQGLLTRRTDASEMSEDALKDSVGVLRRGHATMDIDSVAALLRVPRERVAAVWEDVGGSFHWRAEQDGRWLILEKISQRIFQAFQATLNDVSGRRYNLWTVRLDDKPREAATRLIEAVADARTTIEAAAESVANPGPGFELEDADIWSAVLIEVNTRT